jgi:hypothetical protein
MFSGSYFWRGENRDHVSLAAFPASVFFYIRFLDTYGDGFPDAPMAASRLFDQTGRGNGTGRALLRPIRGI